LLLLLLLFHISISIWLTGGIDITSMGWEQPLQAKLYKKWCTTNSHTAAIFILQKFTIATAAATATATAADAVVDSCLEYSL
jgi:hypothetical protein